MLRQDLRFKNSSARSEELPRFLYELSHVSTSGRTRGFKVHIVVQGGQARSPGSIYALVQAALKAEEFIERLNVDDLSIEKPKSSKRSHALDDGQLRLVDD